MEEKVVKNETVEVADNNSNENIRITYCVHTGPYVKYTNEFGYRVFYSYVDEEGNERWDENGYVLAEGGLVEVRFHYTEYTEVVTDEGEVKSSTENIRVYRDYVNIPKAVCEPRASYKELWGEIEFKEPHHFDEKGRPCNILDYQVIQKCNGILDAEVEEVNKEEEINKIEDTNKEEKVD